MWTTYVLSSSSLVTNWETASCRLTDDWANGFHLSWLRPLLIWVEESNSIFDALFFSISAQVYPSPIFSTPRQTVTYLVESTCTFPYWLLVLISNFIPFFDLSGVGFPYNIRAQVAAQHKYISAEDSVPYISDCTNSIRSLCKQTKVRQSLFWAHLM